MSLWIDHKYVNLVAFHLEGFVQKKPSVWNARCCFCGDSEKSKRLKRFYIYPGKGELSQSLMCKCHNCGYSQTFYSFLEAVDPALHKEYVYERVKEKNAARNVLRSPTHVFKQASSALPTLNDDILRNLPKISELHPDHSARRYCIERKLPEFVLDEFRWSNDFKATASLLNPEASENLCENDPRIVIPFYDEDNDVSVFQGRTIEREVIPKYITIKMNDSVEKVYGINRVDKSKPVIVLEGPIDSVFVENSVATGDSDLTRYKGAGSYVFDHQPRNPQIVSKVKKAINEGYPVFMWPEFMSVGKDINDLVKDGVVEPEELHDLIMQHTVSGMKAKLAFANWRKL